MATKNILPIFALLCLPLSAYDWTADIQNAGNIKNTVQVYYQNGNRDAIQVDTPHIRAIRRHSADGCHRKHGCAATRPFHHLLLLSERV